jgi:hypothetical protein
LKGTLGIHGSLNNTNNSTWEIEIGSLSSSSHYGAVAIDYDGGDAGDGWASGAGVRVDSTTYTSPSPSNGLWDVSDCKGDFDSDGDVDTNDADLFDEAVNDSGYYVLARAGLEGSRIYHGDCNYDGVFNSSDGPGANTAFKFIDDNDCCLDEDAEACPGDVDRNFLINITDLGILLANFGEMGATHHDGDLSGDGSVNITDLGILLANYGGTCSCSPSAASSGSVTTTIEDWDTSGYTGGGFYGEDQHFVFDVVIEIDDEDDDWTAAGVSLTTSNSATLRLVSDPNGLPIPGSGEPDKYSTFFSVIKNVNAGSRFTAPFPSGGIAGKYEGGTGAYVYTTTSLDAAWYDDNETSNDGPAAVLRLVFDVGSVNGADTSGGLGSVYYSTSGPAGVEDIEIGEMDFKTEHKYDGTTGTYTSGSFYVVGE